MLKSNFVARVLLVEDDPISAKVTNILLERHGCLVDWVETGEAGIEHSKRTYDFVLLDLGLPDMLGYGVAEAIRCRQDKTARVPIVFLSANGNLQNKMRSIKARMNGFINKPLTEDGCQWLLQTFVKQKNK